MDNKEIMQEFAQAGIDLSKKQILCIRDAAEKIVLALYAVGISESLEGAVQILINTTTREVNNRTREHELHKAQQIAGKISLKLDRELAKVAELVEAGSWMLQAANFGELHDSEPYNALKDAIEKAKADDNVLAPA